MLLRVEYSFWLPPQPAKANTIEGSEADIIDIIIQDPNGHRDFVCYSNQSTIPDICASVTIASGRIFEDLLPEGVLEDTLITKQLIVTEDIDLSQVPQPLRKKARDVHRRHESLWAGYLGEIKAFNHYIDLIPDSRPFRSQLYSASPKQRELEDEEIRQTLVSNVIRPSKLQ